MSFTTVVDKAVNDLFTEADWDTYIRDNLNKGVVRPVAEVTLASPAASVDFTSIAADWSHLLLAILARSSQASILESCDLRFNADAGNTYDFQTIRATATTPSSEEQLGTTSMAVGQIPGASAPANVFGSGLIFIPSYAHTTPQKPAWGLFGLKWGVATGNLRVRIGAGFWRNAAAINQITLLPSAGNFVAGTRATLYGMGGI